MATRPEQAAVDEVATSGGVWAPTIRYRDGAFWTAETCASFTGRVIGLYACEGTVSFAGFSVPRHRDLMDRIRFGAAYYAEYQRLPDLEADFELMAKASFSVIRVGESVWSTWEPEDGRFELDWLEPVLDAAHRHGIGVVLGTPSATGMASRYQPSQFPASSPATRKIASRLGSNANSARISVVRDDGGRSSFILW